MPVTWKTKSDISESIDTIPSIQNSVKRDFRLPPTIHDDYRQLLAHDIPHVNYTFQLIKDWYNVDEKIYLRAQQTPIDWKSKIGNSDMSTNFKATHDIAIHKGDMVIREDGMIFLLNWNVQNHINNQATQSIECNSHIEFTRKIPDKTDERGMLIVPEHTEIIAPSIPCVHSEYAGRPDYMSSQGSPGIHADHLISIYVQWNDKTKNLRIDDQFSIGAFTYRVVNISIAEVNIEQSNGVLVLHAKRVAGGGIVE